MSGAVSMGEERKEIQKHPGTETGCETRASSCSHTRSRPVLEQDEEQGEQERTYAVFTGGSVAGFLESSK